jgi:hypothetical protein
MVCAGKALNEVITLANQRIAARESKKIEQQGGQFLILSLIRAQSNRKLHCPTWKEGKRWRASK